MASDKEAALAQLTTKVEPLVAKERQLESATSSLKTVEGNATGYRDWLLGKYRWVDLLSELRRALQAAEEKARPNPGVDVGVWVESFRMGNVSKEFGDTAQPEEQQQEETTQQTSFKMSPELMCRYGLLPPSSAPAAEGEGGGEGATDTSAATETAKKKTSTNEVHEIELVLKAVNLSSLSPTRNLYIARAVEEELKASSYFNSTNTRLGKQLPPEPDSPTFTFELTLGLKDPIKL
jgi:hypothetical protein